MCQIQKNRIDRIMKLIDKNIKQYEKYWENTRDKHEEDIFYNTLTKLRELREEIRK